MISKLSLIICGLLGLSLHLLVEAVPVKTKRSPAELADSSLHLGRKGYDNDALMTENPNDVYNEGEMPSNELKYLSKKRRSMQFNHRRKRSSYYNINPSPDSYLDQQAFNRPLFADAGLDRRTIRSNYWDDYFAKNKENVEDTMPVYFYPNEDDISDEYNRYPISFNSPYDNLQLQQEYNIKSPFDDYDETYTL